MCNEPVPLRDALAEVSRDLGVPEPDVHARAVALWREVVGTVVAEHARVRSVRDGVCTVTVDAPEWATQLRYLEEGVVRRASEVLGPGVVTTVKVVVAPPSETAHGDAFW
jgi:predicted nucleic acid-binding Zn ribbon protein